MIERFSESITRLASAKRILTMLVFMVILVAFMMPATSNAIKAMSGGVDLLDTCMVCSAEDIYARIQAYGEEGRQFHVRATATIDIALPLTYTLFEALLIAFLLKSAGYEHRILRRLSLVPFIAGGLDLLENAGIILLLTVYPQRYLVLAEATSALTLLKWGFNALSLLLGMLAAGLWIWRRIRPK